MNKSDILYKFFYKCILFLNSREIYIGFLLEGIVDMLCCKVAVKIFCYSFFLKLSALPVHFSFFGLLITQRAT